MVMVSRARARRYSPLRTSSCIPRTSTETSLHASRLRLGMIVQVANQAPAPVKGEDRRRFVGELQAHQAVAMDEAGALAACCGAVQNPRVDDAVYLPERHAGHACRLVGRQRPGCAMAGIVYPSSIPEEI